MCFIAGIIAIIFSVMSTSQADSGNMDSARSYGKVALYLNIASVVLTAIIIMIVIIVVVAGSATAGGALSASTSELNEACQTWSNGDLINC